MMWMTEKELKVLFLVSINELDIELQTYGCKDNNLDIYSNNSVKEVCAFTLDDCICRKLSRISEKQYIKLKEGEAND